MLKVLLGGAAIAAIVAAALFWGSKIAPTPTAVLTDVSPSVVVTSAPVNSKYLDYTPEVYASSRDKRRVLYFFATWCPTCSVANQDFTVNSSQIPADVVIFRTDYDREIELKRKYAITYQHTFVQVDREGNELAKWNGGGLSELSRNIK